MSGLISVVELGLKKVAEVKCFTRVHSFCPQRTRSSSTWPDLERKRRRLKRSCWVSGNNEELVEPGNKENPNNESLTL